MKSSQSGITLIELMIVVVIIGILAGIAYPSYRAQVVKSNRTEAKMALEQTAGALEKCFTRYMAYNDANCPASTQFNAGASFTTPEGNYRITGVTAAATFTLTATPAGSQVGDAQCGNFTLNQTGTRAVTGTLTAVQCW